MADFLAGVDPDSIFYAIFAFAWIEFIWEAYLSARQRKVKITFKS